MYTFLSKRCVFIIFWVRGNNSHKVPTIYLDWPLIRNLNKQIRLHFFCIIHHHSSSQKEVTQAAISRAVQRYTCFNNVSLCLLCIIQNNNNRRYIERNRVVRGQKNGSGPAFGVSCGTDSLLLWMEWRIFFPRRCLRDSGTVVRDPGGGHPGGIRGAGEGCSIRTVRDD